MNIQMTLNKIINHCYCDRYNEAAELVQALLDEMGKEEVFNSTNLPILKLMLFAMENEDNILLGDCIEYGLIRNFNNEYIQKDIFDKEIINIPNIEEKIFYYASFCDEPVLCIHNNEGKIIRLNSVFSPINEVENWIDNQTINLKTPVVCLFGIGTGLFAESLLKKMSDNSILLLYEPNREAFDFCIDNGDKPEAEINEKRISERIKRIISDERTVIYIESEDKVGFRYLLEKYVGYMEISSLVVTKHNSYDKIYPKSCLSYYRDINYHRSKTISNKNTTAFFKEHFVESLFRNLWLCRKMNTCEELDSILPDDIPVIIVSAGPSLEKNVNILLQAKGHCLIVAVDTAVRYLVKQNILPDIIITIDSIKPTSYLSDEAIRYVPCIFDITANPEIANKLRGRIFLFNSSDFYIIALFETIGKVFDMNVSGGSVATAAFVLMYSLGQKKIILVGQDLAYANGATHVGEVNDNANLEESLVDGYYGEKVTTRSDWLNYLRWFEKTIEAIKINNQNIRVIDATEGGAKIHGAEIMSLQDAIDDCRDSNGNLPTYCFEEQLNQLDYFLNEQEYKDLMNNHYAAIEKLKEIKIKADEAVYMCKKILERIEKGMASAAYINKEKKKISIINDWCSKTTIFPLLNNYLITDVIDEVSRLRYEDGDIKTTEMNGINLMKLSFEAIAEAAEKIYDKANEIKKSDDRLSQKNNV